MAILGDTIVTNLEISNGIQFSDKSSSETLINIVYPVGSIYVFWDRNNPVPETCPIEQYGGTWERIEDRFLFAIARDSDEYGKTGGAKEAYLPNHKHDFANSSKTYTTTENGYHNHKLSIDDNDFPGGSGSKVDTTDRYRLTSTDSKESGSITADSGFKIVDATNVLIESNGSHTHTITINQGDISGKTSDIKDVENHTRTAQNPGDSATANMPPYLGVVAWVRTA